MPTIKGDKEVHVTEDDDLATVTTDGNLKVSLDSVQKVSIYNIIRVQRYDLSKTDDFIIHEIQFFGGGMAKLSYSKTGKIMEFRSRGILILVEGDHVTLDIPG